MFFCESRRRHTRCALVTEFRRVLFRSFPTRIAFMVTSKIDSRTILGEQGAEQLLGNGDMLYMASGGRTKRLHGPFVADSEVEAVVNHLKSQGAPSSEERRVGKECGSPCRSRWAPDL